MSQTQRLTARSYDDRLDEATEEVKHAEARLQRAAAKGQFSSVQYLEDLRLAALSRQRAITLIRQALSVDATPLAVASMLLANEPRPEATRGERDEYHTEFQRFLYAAAALEATGIAQA